MTLIDYKLVDLSILDKLQSQQNFRINYDNIIGGAVIYNGHTPAAFGVIKKFSELVFVANQDVPKITRAKAMMELMNHATYLAHKHNLEQIHFTVEDERLKKAMIENYGFKQIPDPVLVKNV